MYWGINVENSTKYYSFISSWIWDNISRVNTLKSSGVASTLKQTCYGSMIITKKISSIF